MKKQNFEIVTRDKVETVQGTLFVTPELPEVKFFIYKKNYGYSLSEVKSGLEVFNGITVKEVKQKLYDYFKNYDKNNIVACVNNAKSVAEVREKYHKKDKYLNEFSRIFGFNAPICLFTNSLDVIRLDKILGTENLDGISMSDYIVQKYGNYAHQVVLNLM